MGWLISLKAQLIAAALVAVISFASGVKVTSWYYKAEHAKELEAEIAAKMAWIEYGDKKSSELEKKLAEQRRINRSLNQKVQNEVKSNDIYNLVLPDSGVRLFNQLQSGEAETTGKSNSGVGSTSSTSKSFFDWGFLHPLRDDSHYVQ